MPPPSDFAPFVSYIKVDEEKKVAAVTHSVREFYKNMSGNFATVERLQLLSG